MDAPIGQVPSRSRLFLYDTSTRLILKLLNSGGNILITGWLIHILGQEAFGLFRSASASVALLSLAGGGMTGASFALIVRYISQNNIAACNQVFSNSVRYLSAVGGLVILLSWPAGFVLAKIYNIEPRLVGQFQTASCFVSIGLGLGFIAMPFIWIIQARQKEHILNLLHWPHAILAPLVTFLIVLKMPYASGPALGIMVMALLGCILCIVTSVKMHPWLHFDRKAKHEEVHQRTKYSFIEQVAGLVVSQVIVWSVTFHSGVSVLSQVVVSMTFYAFARDLILTLNTTLVAPVGNLFHTGQTDRARQSWLDSCLISAVFCLAGAGTLFLINFGLISNWVGVKMYAGNSLNLLFAISLLITGLNTPSYAILYAFDGYKERMIFLSVEAIFGLAFSFGLGMLYGALGAVGGALIGQAIGFLFYPLAINKRLSIPIGQCLLGFVRLLVVGALAILLLEALPHLPERFGLLGSLAQAAIDGSVILLLLVAFGLNKPTRGRLFQRFASMFSKISPPSELHP